MMLLRSMLVMLVLTLALSAGVSLIVLGIYLMRRRRRAWALAVAVLVVAALVAARRGWQVYVTSPWTRDGMVRVQVANVAPQVSGQIVEIRTHDNAHVHPHWPAPRRRFRRVDFRQADRNDRRQ